MILNNECTIDIMNIFKNNTNFSPKWLRRRKAAEINRIYLSILATTFAIPICLSVLQSIGEIKANMT